MSGAKGPKARKAPANKAGVIWWSTEAEKRKRRRKSRKARAALERNEALVLTAKNRKVFQESCAGSCRAKDNIPRRQHVKPNAPNLCRQSGKSAENPRLWKYFLEHHFPQAVPVTRGQGQSPALEGSAHANFRVTPHLPRGGRSRKSGRLEPALRHFLRL